MAEDIEAKEISQLESLAVSDSALIPIYDPQYGLGKATMDSIKEVCGVGTTRNGVCSTAGATQDKAVNYTGFILSDGKEIVVKFTNANTAANPRLNVNSTGAKTIKFIDQASGVSAGLNCFVDGAYYKFTYNAADDVWVCHSNIVERDSSAGYTKYADGRNVHTSTYTVNLGNLIWYTSQYGLRYSSAFAGLVAKKIYTVNITGFTVLSDLVHPILTNDGKQIRFTTMISNIHTAATVDLKVEYEL